MRRKGAAQPVAIEISTNTRGVEESHGRAVEAAKSAAEAAESAAAAAAALERIAESIAAPRQPEPQAKKAVTLAVVYLIVGIGLAAAQILGWLDAATLSAIALFLTPAGIAIAVVMYYVPRAKD